MKRKNVSILILVILVIIAFCWVLIPDKYTENYDWTLFIWVVPLCFFAIQVFSKQSSKKSFHQVIYAVALGMIIPVLLSTDFNLDVIFKKVLSILAGSVITLVLYSVLAKFDKVGNCNE